MARAPTVCRERGCPEFSVKGGLCGVHQPAHGWGSSTRVKPAGWERIRRRVLRRDRWCCVVCGGRADVVDHLLPMAWGGGESMGNLRALCGRCHRAKSGHEREIGKRGRDPGEVREFLSVWGR